MDSEYPASKPRFETDDGSVSTSILVDRLWWALGISGSMGLVALVFVWVGFSDGVSELVWLGALSGLFSAYTAVRGISVFAELRGRKLLDSARE